MFVNTERVVQNLTYQRASVVQYNSMGKSIKGILQQILWSHKSSNYQPDSAAASNIRWRTAYDMHFTEHHGNQQRRRKESFVLNIYCFAVWLLQLSRASESFACCPSAARIKTYHTDGVSYVLKATASQRYWWEVERCSALCPLKKTWTTINNNRLFPYYYVK